MLRRNYPQPSESIDMLRDKGMKQYTEVYTADGERLGVTMRFVHRPIEEVNIELKLYRSYLVIQSLQHGGTMFIPTVFIDDYDPAANRVTLTANIDMVMNEVWNREPDFVARGLGVTEELPE